MAAAAAWKTKCQKGRKWANTSWKKYHCSPMLGVRSATCIHKIHKVSPKMQIARRGGNGHLLEEVPLQPDVGAQICHL
jgi:hypothetical protein